MQETLTHDTVLEAAARSAWTEHHLHILRWLIWFSLLCTPDVARLLDRSEKTAAALLKEMEDAALIAHVTLSEAEVSAHYRYTINDLGLYVFATLAQPPLPVQRLVQAYAVDHADLVARLLRPDQLFLLTEIATRLVAEGRTLGYPLTSFQQPWMQTDRVFGTRQTLRFAAAFLIGHPQGSEHACYLHLDAVETRPFDEKRERLRLNRLLQLREEFFLRGEPLPPLLIVTHASRLLEWAQLLARLHGERTSLVIEGGITTVSHVAQGVHSPIWWTLEHLLTWANEQRRPSVPTAGVPLVEVLGPPASRDLIERFAQRDRFAHLLAEPLTMPQRRGKGRLVLPRYVGPTLSERVAALEPQFLTQALTGTKRDQQEGSVLLSLALQSGQKAILSWLTHHPLLTIHDLAALFVPSSGDIRVVQRQMEDLYRLELLIRFHWSKADHWSRRERYLLSEAALRYIAVREGLPATTYLLPPHKKKNAGPLSIQSGAGALFAQMLHTDGVYRCVRQLLYQAYHAQVRVLLWKNEPEAIRTYPHPHGYRPMQIRPDAELVYLLPGETVPRSVLLEYDRDTTVLRDCRAKFGCYADYLAQTRTPFPPIALITQSEQRAHRLRTLLSEMEVDLPITMFLETDLSAATDFFGSLPRPP